MSRLITAVVAVVVVAVTSSAQEHLVGTWAISFGPPDDVVLAELVLNQQDGRIHGAYTSPQMTAPVSGEAKGNSFVIRFTFQSPDGPVEIRIDGAVNRDVLQGKIDNGTDQLALSGKRK